MDPNEALKIIRKLADGVIADEYQDDEARELAEAMKSLDEWLSKGGFLPDDWKAMSSNGW